MTFLLTKTIKKGEKKKKKTARRTFNYLYIVEAEKDKF
jgi:hypothetical protein